MSIGTEHSRSTIEVAPSNLIHRNSISDVIGNQNLNFNQVVKPSISVNDWMNQEIVVDKQHRASVQSLATDMQNLKRSDSTNNVYLEKQL